MAERILVVEDNPALNDMVSELLSLEGYECLQAHDGEQAQRAFEAHSPDAVLLDLQLPALHGMDVLRHVKTRNPFTVVVILTGHGDGRVAVQALKLGADAYLTKPIDRAELLNVLNANLHRARREREVEKRSKWPGEVLDHWMGRVFLDAPAALVHVDPTGIIRVANRAAARLLARQSEELLGRPLGDLAGEAIRESWLTAMRRDAASPRGYDGEIHLRRADGEWFPAHVAAVERPEKGHLLLALRDLTRQRAIEKEFAESKRLASLGHVVEGVAHEVRNPLISIGGFSRKLLKGSADGSRERRYLDIIVHEVERLENMVRDIERYVVFARTRARNFASVDLRELLGETLKKVALRADPEGKVSVELDRDGDLPVVFGDGELLASLFDVLLENAWEAMPEGGTLRVGFERKSGYVLVHVRDTGVGIEASDLEKIFTPFFTSKTAGAGLGLAKAYLIVEDHAGHIQFSSEPGKGTQCTVTFPVERRALRRVEG